MDKVAVLGTWAGLGDNVQLTPAIIKYKELNPDTKIILLTLERFGQKSIDLWQGIVDDVRPCLKDAWEFGDYAREGVPFVKKQIDDVADAEGAGEIYYLSCSGTGAEDRKNYKFNKVFRFATELGVELDNFDEAHTNLATSVDDVQAMWEEFGDSYVVLHRSANVPKKSLTDEDLESSGVIKDILTTEGMKVVEIDISDGLSKFANIGFDTNERSFKEAKALVAGSQAVVAADSVIMHVAGAFDRPLVAYFKSTLTHQAFPLWYSSVSAQGEHNAITELNDINEHLRRYDEDYPDRR